MCSTRELPAAGRAYDRSVVCVLAVSDEVDEGLYADLGPVRAAKLVVACGDLPFEYLGYLMNGLDVPLVFVPGNHDPDLSGYRNSRAGLTLRAGLPTRTPWPDGADPPHRGFAALHGLVARLQPTMLLHGHVLRCDAAAPDRRLGRTMVRNVIGRHLLDIRPGAEAADVHPGHRHAR